MGNRSIGSAPAGVPRVLVRVPGFWASASVGVPRAHPHALWVLPWVEAILKGRRIEDLLAAPPWPSPADPLVARALCRVLFDLRWAVPDWTTGVPVIAEELASAFKRGGRPGLAETLFDAEIIDGQWWAEGVEGTLLSRQTAIQFDWDHKRMADHVLRPSVPPGRLLEQQRFDLRDLLRKLGGVASLGGNLDRAFLASPLMPGEPKDILFEAYGTEQKLIPEELAELVPVLERVSPELLGVRRAAESKVVQSKHTPVESIASAWEELTSPRCLLGPAQVWLARVEHFAALVEKSSDELGRWLEHSVECRPVIGPTQRHFDALREMCVDMAGVDDPYVLLTTAFLRSRNALEADGLAEAMAAAPAATRFVVVYGHANDDLPEQQAEEIAAWRNALVSMAPSLEGRVEVCAGERRSHEKVVVTASGEWLVGSWNPGSSRPHSTVFECSLRGTDATVALALLTRIGQNISPSRREAIVSSMTDAIGALPRAADAAIATKVDELRRAAALLYRCASLRGGTNAVWRQAWDSSARAMSAALLPFFAAAQVQLIDEFQTRDALMIIVESARSDVLVASDRLSEGALDPATLKTFADERNTSRILRVVWGREWAGGRVTDAQSRAQLQRARDAVRAAREVLGLALSTSDEPMENHAKCLVVDGLRGLVTSENLLAYGGEKSKYESRELGLMFWSPIIARHILGRSLLEWPGHLRNSLRGDDCRLAWAIAGNEAWHSLQPLDGQLEFEWRAAKFIEKVVRDETRHHDSIAEGGTTDTDGWRDLVDRSGGATFAWVRSEAERIGLVRPHGGELWCPYDAAGAPATGDALGEAELLLLQISAERLNPAPTVESGRAAVIAHPLVEAVGRELIVIPAGQFLMGDDRVAQERPLHRVRITRPFGLARTPVTQRLWVEVMGRLPHLRDVERNPDYPIIHVSRDEMVEFITRLNRLPGGVGFVLPTEAQWEHACRAGASTNYCFGDDPGGGEGPGLLEQYAWTKRNANARLQKVGQLTPNRFGLCDMHGLVYETMRDGFRTYTASDVVDPIGPLDGDRYVARGGFWGRFPVDRRNPSQEHFRCASRQTYEQSHRVSFRLAREVGGIP